MKQILSTENAPAAIGPYSQAVAYHGILYVSGQIPLMPATGDLVDGGIAEQTERVLENLKAVLEASGSSLKQVLKTTVYLTDMSDFRAMNEIYARYFSEAPPARSTVAVSTLPRNVRVEIEAIAAVP